MRKRQRDEGLQKNRKGGGDMDRGAESYRSYLNGDDDGLRQLIEAYRTPLQLFLQTFVRDAALAEDLTQETFLRLACRRPRFDGRCAFKTWLYQIGLRGSRPTAPKPE